jgi:hypothetical protein
VENPAALDVMLSPEGLAALEPLARQVAGDRYSADLVARVERQAVRAAAGEDVPGEELPEEVGPRNAAGAPPWRLVRRRGRGRVVA